MSQSTMNIQIEKFDGSNWQTWDVSIRALLGVNDLDGFLDGTAEIIGTSAEIDAEVQSTPYIPAVRARPRVMNETGDQELTPAVEGRDAVMGTPYIPAKHRVLPKDIITFGQRSKRAAELITLNVDQSLYHYFDGNDTCEARYNALHNKFGKPSAMGAFNLRHKLMRYQFVEGESYKRQISELYALRSRMASAGIHVQEREFAMTVLQALPHSWDGFRTTILASTSDINDLEATTFINRIYEEEAQRSGGNSSVNNATRNVTRKGKCNYCKREGHWEAECRTKAADKANGKTRPTGSTSSSGKKKFTKKGKGHSRAHVTDSANTTTFHYCCVAGLSKSSKNVRGIELIVDTGATDHISNERDDFTRFESFSSAKLIRVANGETMEAKGSGTCAYEHVVEGEKRIIEFRNVLYVPTASIRLISISKLDDGEVTTTIIGSTCSIVSRKNGRTLLQAHKRDGLYRVKVQAPARALAVETSNKPSLQTLHRRLGHVNFKTIQKMINENLIEGIKLSNSEIIRCEDCVFGKAHRHPFEESKSPPATKPLQLVHSDLMGPMRVQSKGGALYWLTFIDDYSGMHWGFPIANKSDTFTKFKEWLIMVENESGQKLKVFRTDNGGEYTSNEFEAFLKSKGIRHETSVPYSPQSNGVAERFNRTITESARSSMQQSGLTGTWWAEAFVTANHALNRTLSRVRDKVPYELWTGKKPDISYLRPFGCMAYKHVPSHERSKIDAKAVKTVFIGYIPGTKGYRLYDPDKRTMQESRDVIFDETLFPLAKKVTINPVDLSQPDEEDPIPVPGPRVQTPALGPVTPPNYTPQYTPLAPTRQLTEPSTRSQTPVTPTPGPSRALRDTSPSEPSKSPKAQPKDDEAESDTSEDSEDSENEVEGLTEEFPILNDEDPTRTGPTLASENLRRLQAERKSEKQQMLKKTGSKSHLPPSPIQQRRSTRTKMKSDRLRFTEEEGATREELLQEMARLRKKLPSRKPSKRMANIIEADEYGEADEWNYFPEIIGACFGARNCEEPVTFQQAISANDGLDWQAAMAEEKESLERNNTFTLVDLPAGRKAIKGKWVYKIKYNAEGEPIRAKARYVAKGYSQIEGVDFNEVFAPVARYESIRILLALATINNWEIHQMDVKTAFLNGDLDEEIYMEQPEGFIDPHRPSMVYRLHKAIYGLKQAARVWNDKINSTLVEMGFERLTSDYGIYVFKQGESKFISNKLGGISMFIVLYVDDINIIGNNMDAINKVKKRLRTKFDMTDAGEAAFFLGIRIRRDRERQIMWLDQFKYIQDILKTFHLDDAKTRKTHNTPFAANTHLIKNENPPENCDPNYRRHYQSIIGHLMYASLCTRPDISWAVNKLAQFNTNPDDNHLSAANHLLRYVKATQDFCLVYKGKSAYNIIGYVDADWGDVNGSDRKSTTGNCYIIAGGAVLWNSRKQTTVALSTLEAEYLATTDAMKQARWLQIFFDELQRPIGKPILVYNDNQGSISFIKNPGNHQRTKHIDIRSSRIREEVGNSFDLEHIATEQMTADILTKGLPYPLHAAHRDGLGLNSLNGNFKSTVSYLFTPLDKGECWIL